MNAYYIEAAQIAGIGKYYVVYLCYKPGITKEIDGHSMTVVLDIPDVWHKWIRCEDVFSSYEAAFAEAEKRNIIIQDAVL